MQRYDVAVIGAGVTGAAIARTLSQYRIRLALIEAREDIAMGASRANSAIVHAGYDCVPGTLMARLNVEGNRLYDEWAAQLDVPLKRIGSLVIAIGAEQDAAVKALYERGIENGVPGMKILSGEEARAMEPSLSEEVTSALYASTGAITCPYEMTIACAENARMNGCDWLMNFPAEKIEKRDGVFVLTGGGRSIEAEYIVNAAGVYADDVARLIGDDSFVIRPRKGEYLLMDHGSNDIRTVIFQTPSKLGKGVLVSPTVDGNVFAGPTAVDGEDKADTSVSQESIDMLKKQACLSVPALNFRQVITQFAGVRAQPEPHDFILRASEKDPHFIHAAGICSPGLSSAPAISYVIRDLLKEAGLALEKKPDHDPTRKAIRAFRHMTDAERAAAIKEDPLYARVICRCETITEAEIVEAVRRGARSIDGVKRRTRAGMGRCQGGFCSPRVMEIISREAGIPMEELTKFGGGSYIVVGRTK